MNDLDILRDMANQLKLSTLKTSIMKFIEEAEQGSETYKEFLFKILKAEVERKEKDALRNRIKRARFPYPKEIETFDTTFQKSIDKTKINILKEMKWVDNIYNLIFLGPPGVGKSHLMIGLGYRAAELGYHVLFLTMSELIYFLKNKDSCRKSKEVINRLNKCDLLMIDEVGYIPLTKEDANLFFEIVSGLHEKTSICITSNKDFSQWTELLQDEALATAILDRLVYRCQVFNLKGNSYRLENRETIFK